MAYILLVQRDADMRQLLRMVLRSSYMLEEASDSEEALEILRESEQPLLVMLGDWPRAWSEELLRTCEGDPELRRHVYMLVSVNHDGLAPGFRNLLERLSVRVVRVPFELSELEELVQEAYACADAQGRTSSGVSNAHGRWR